MDKNTEKQPASDLVERATQFLQSCGEDSGYITLAAANGLVKYMADFANLHASQQNADLSRKVRELEGLLKVAKCPTCDGSGMYPQHSAYCNGDCQDCPEPVQCEWCDRRQAFAALEDK